MMKGFATLALVAALAAPLLAAQFTSIYTPPNAVPTSFSGKKVAVLVMTDDQALRMSAEEALARALATRNVQAVASYRTIPREELQNKDRAKQWFADSGVEGAVILRPIQLEHKVTKHAPGWTSSNYQSFWGYYTYGAAAAYTPGHTTRETIVVVEALVYSVTRDALLWGAVSDTTDPNSMDAYMKQLVGDAVKEMRKAGLVEK